MFEFAEKADDDLEDEVEEKVAVFAVLGFTVETLISFQAAMQTFVLILLMKEFVPQVNLLFQEVCVHLARYDFIHLFDSFQSERGGDRVVQQTKWSHRA